MKRFLLISLFLFPIRIASMEYKKVSYDDSSIRRIIAKNPISIGSGGYAREIGSVEYTVKKQNNRSPFCYINLIAVREEFRKQGIGSELIKQTLEDMKLHGCKKAELCSVAEAVNFYEKIGFEHVPFFSNLWRTLSTGRPVSMQYDLTKK